MNCINHNKCKFPRDGDLLEILETADIVNLPYTGSSEIVAILRNLRSIEYIFRSFYLEDHL